MIHCHDFDTLPIGFILAKVKRCKLVYDVHEHFAKMIQFDVSEILGKIIDLLEGQFVKHVDLTITVGEILASALKKKRAKNVYVVGNWKNVSDFSIDLKELMVLRKELGINGNERLIIAYITSLKEERKIRELIQAVQEQKDFVLIIGGKGPLEGFLKAEGMKRSNVKFVGFVNPREIPKYTALSDIIFYGFDPENGNSQYSAPNKLFEALAAGKGIISGNFGEIALIVKNYGCGLVLKNYVPSTIRNAFEYFVRNPDKLMECQRNAFLMGKTEYNWDRAKKILCVGYEKLFK